MASLRYCFCALLFLLVAGIASGERLLTVHPLHGVDEVFPLAGIRSLQVNSGVLEIRPHDGAAVVHQFQDTRKLTFRDANLSSAPDRPVTFANLRPLQIAPNPFGKSVILRTADGSLDGAVVRLYGVDGSLAWGPALMRPSSSAGVTELTLDPTMLRDLATGIYWFEVRAGGFRFAAKGIHLADR